MRLTSLCNSKAVPLSVKVPPLLVKLSATASVLSCITNVPPLTAPPFSKVILPPLEVKVVPDVRSAIPPVKVRSARSVAIVPAGVPVFVPLLLEALRSSVKSVVSEASVKVKPSKFNSPKMKP